MMEEAHFLVVILCIFLLTMLYLWLLHVRAALMWLYYGLSRQPRAPVIIIIPYDDYCHNQISTD